MYDVFIAMVVDKSGSMFGLRQATVDGYNTFLAEQRELQGSARMSLTLFDTYVEKKFSNKEIHNVKPWGYSDYSPSGNTALLDAVGRTIKETESAVAKGNFKGKVIVAIWTDGQENSSTEWHINQPPKNGDDRDLLGLLRWKQSEGWEFMFLGAGGSEWLERTFGSVVRPENFYGYVATAGGQSAAYAGMTQTISTVRNTGNFVPPTST